MDYTPICTITMVIPLYPEHLPRVNCRRAVKMIKGWRGCLQGQVEKAGSQERVEKGYDGGLQNDESGRQMQESGRQMLVLFSFRPFYCDHTARDRPYICDGGNLRGLCHRDLPAYKAHPAEKQNR